MPAVADSSSLPLCAIGFATDALDGPLARRTAPTRLGRDMEGVVDATFVAAALRGARRRGRLSAPVVAAERIRLALGFGYAVAAYVGWAHPPDARTLGAARAVAAPIRAAALILAAAGRRNLGDRLLLCTSAMSIATLPRAAARGGAPTAVT